MNALLQIGQNSAVPLAEAELRELLLEYRRENWKGIQTESTQRQIVDDMLHGDALALLRELEGYLPIGRESRVLDLGSGVGSFVVACRNRGLHAFGLEPDRIGRGAKITSIQIARRRLIAPVFANGVGESLPFPDGCFDLVVMNHVIEHVADQAKVLREAARVVREGGAVYVACPNYMRWCEPHYKIFWVPLLPKVLGKIYLRLRGRSGAMLDQLTYTTHKRLRKRLAALGPEYVVTDLHREEFLRKRSEGSFAATATRFVSRLTYMPMIGPLALRIVLKYASLTDGDSAMLILRRPKAAAE